MERLNIIDASTAPYFKAGKLVRLNDCIYKLMGSPTEDGLVTALDTRKEHRYASLRYRLGECSGGSIIARTLFDEMHSYEEQINIIGAEAVGGIRILDSRYATKYLLRDLDHLIVNGIVAQVIGLERDNGNGAGATHFHFINGTGLAGMTFHINEFADLVERCRCSVEPIEYRNEPMLFVG